jgi:hypothetical protein
MLIFNRGDVPAALLPEYWPDLRMINITGNGRGFVWIDYRARPLYWLLTDCIGLKVPAEVPPDRRPEYMHITRLASPSLPANVSCGAGFYAKEPTWVQLDRVAEDFPVDRGDDALSMDELRACASVIIPFLTNLDLYEKDPALSSQVYGKPDRHAGTPRSSLSGP